MQQGRVLGGRYRLLERIGAGGMGTVWRARDERLERQVAVKTLAGAPEQLQEELTARFEREARLVARLHSPHIVTVHDYGQHDFDDDQSVLYLVMEEILGRSLDKVLIAGPPALPDVTAWAQQICRALEQAHSSGIVHRDLKPGNVMIDDDGRAVVLDFGIAGITDGSSELTRTGAAPGTPAYMSPEQARGDRTVDHRSDLYALGCLLYAMLTCRPPFPDGAWHTVLRHHMDTPPQPPSAHRQGLPPQWDELVLRLLAKQPHDRPSSARTVREALATGSVLPRQTPTTLDPGGGDYASAETRPAAGLAHSAGPPPHPPGGQVGGLPQTGHPSIWPTAHPATPPAQPAARRTLYPFGSARRAPLSRRHRFLVVLVGVVFAVGLDAAEFPFSVPFGVAAALGTAALLRRVSARR